MLSRAVSSRRPVVATTIVSAAELAKEGAALAEQAYIRLVPTAKAKPTAETEQTAGMMIKAAAPVLDQEGGIIGVLYGGNSAEPELWYC